MPILVDTQRLQPPVPGGFRVPTLVQPQWKWRELLKGSSGNRIYGDLCDEIRRQYGVKHCLLIDRARTGLYLLNRGMGLGGEWLTTSFMHRPTAVLLRNIVSGLAFADVQEDFTMDPQSAESRIAGSTEAILVTHMYGKSADIRTFRKIADRRTLFLIENAVHIPGGTAVDGKLLGSWGDAAILSFNVDKPLGGILGGALLTNRDDVWRAVTAQPLSTPGSREACERILTTYAAYRLKPLIMRLAACCHNVGPRDGVKEVEAFGMSTYQHYTARGIHALQASVALSVMRRSVALRQARVMNAEYLISRLKGIGEIVLPSASPAQPHSFLYFPVLFNGIDRFEAGSRYAGLGIETKWRYYPLHLQEDFSDCRHDSLERTEHCWRHHLLLPVGPDLTKAHLSYIAECTESILRSGQSPSRCQD